MSMIDSSNPLGFLEALNQSLFFIINAPEHPAPWMFSLARFFAQDCILVVPLILCVGWLGSTNKVRYGLLEATMSGIFGLSGNLLIGLLWQHPRPFMIGIGHTLIPHIADSSFPSDHLTLVWAVAFSLCLHRESRTVGTALAVLGIPIAWARVYLGVHFPFDIFGSAIVAIVIAILTHQLARPLTTPVFLVARHLYGKLFNRLIQKGWVKP
jgi:undecaprenyl-diphosphatase